MYRIPVWGILLYSGWYVIADFDVNVRFERSQYRSLIASICVNGGGNATPLRGIGEYLVIFFETSPCFREYRFILAGR
ncbi:hypothetical protein [Pseudanabaena sp. lw0831]|uniref:hypothetical protein n=1 Tax=Pseudanabaena sp. lw0831 TaxID=1357935 RepID=UPI001915B571|nr:hypothetical protein [Pseudanabaena sp. lw0831]